MTANLEPNKPTSVARMLGLLVFALMSLISLVILFTEDQLTGVDYLLLLGGPPALGILTYVTNLYHDPTAAD